MFQQRGFEALQIVHSFFFFFNPSNSTNLINGNPLQRSVMSFFFYHYLDMVCPSQWLISQSELRVTFYSPEDVTGSYCVTSYLPEESEAGKHRVLSAWKGGSDGQSLPRSRCLGLQFSFTTSQ